MFLKFSLNRRRLWQTTLKDKERYTNLVDICGLGSAVWSEQSHKRRQFHIDKLLTYLLDNIIFPTLRAELSFDFMIKVGASAQDL